MVENHSVQVGRQSYISAIHVLGLISVLCVAWIVDGQGEALVGFREMSTLSSPIKALALLVAISPMGVDTYTHSIVTCCCWYQPQTLVVTGVDVVGVGAVYNVVEDPSQKVIEPPLILSTPEV